MTVIIVKLKIVTTTGCYKRLLIDITCYITIRLKFQQNNNNSNNNRNGNNSINFKNIYKRLHVYMFVGNNTGVNGMEYTCFFL